MYRLPPGSAARSTAVGATSSGRPKRPSGKAGLQRRLPLLGEVGAKRGLNRAGGDAVDRHPGPSHLTGQRLGEADDTGLGRCVVGETSPASLPDLGGDVDDAAEARLEHRRQPRAAADEDTAQVDRDHLVPHLRRHVADVAFGDDPGVVDQDLHRSELVARDAEHLFHASFVTDVGPDRHHLGSRLPAPSRHVLEARPPAPVGQAQGRAGHGERPGDRRTDTARRARDQRGAASQNRRRGTGRPCVAHSCSPPSLKIRRAFPSRIRDLACTPLDGQRTSHLARLELSLAA